ADPYPPGRPHRPTLQKKASECGYPIPLDRNHDIARLDFGARRGSFRRNADHDDLAFNFGRIKPEPGPYRPVNAAKFAQISEYWMQHNDRLEHVKMLIPDF